MAESPSKHPFTNDRHPFDNFQETVRNLLQVPKREAGKAQQGDGNHERKRNRETPPDEKS